MTNRRMAHRLREKAQRPNLIYLVLSDLQKIGFSPMPGPDF
jgi:hypothetical protein